MDPSTPWSVDSWRRRPIAQAISYPQETLPKLEDVKAKLKQLPGLVTPHEVRVSLILFLLEILPSAIDDGDMLYSDPEIEGKTEARRSW
jgi:hypothetical protein